MACKHEEEKKIWQSACVIQRMKINADLPNADQLTFIRRQSNLLHVTFFSIQKEYKIKYERALHLKPSQTQQPILYLQRKSVSSVHGHLSSESGSVKLPQSSLVSKVLEMSENELYQLLNHAFLLVFSRLCTITRFHRFIYSTSCVLLIWSKIYTVRPSRLKAGNAIQQVNRDPADNC